MKVYTIGFTQKTAEEFFESLKREKVVLLIDTRINNTSQLAGFAKARDLEYFLQQIGGIKYTYRPDFAPTQELLKNWRNKKISWEDYEAEYDRLLKLRGTYRNFLRDYEDFERVCLLCSEATPEHCHRRLFAEKLEQTFPGEIEVVHL